jgi:Xaa-Pro aminopeptidase
MQISDKLLLLRNKMAALGMDACIIPSGDPHLSEYPSEHWKIREWLSHFSGSAGTLVVTAEEAGLWTDSRYFLQAEEQLDAGIIQLFKEGEKGVPDYTAWLHEVLMPGDKVAVNGATVSVSQLRRITRELRNSRIQVDSTHSIAEDVWEARIPIPENTVFVHEDKWSGFSRSEKLEQVRELMKKNDISYYITATLDEIAWVLNLRGNDVPFNPVFHAFMIIEFDKVRLYINPHKLTAQIARKLEADNIKISLYEEVYKHLNHIPDDASVLLDPDRTNSAIYAALSPKVTKKESVSFITRLKAQKNETEVNNLKQTLINDGVAMVQFLKWLEDSIGKEKITEVSAAKKLKSMRAAQPGFVGESFGTISGYAGHGAIVHYNANEASDVELKPEGLFLIDSGGQYHGGTTDITRTLALGPCPEQAKTDYTLVLKGHIALACAIFPQGTRGVHLDILARKALWQHGLNYGHGTGHGIGYFLNVHEGPQSIRPQDNGIEIEPGMVSSNEPGVYRRNAYGIRIENLIISKIKEETDFGCFMEFETLTLCPIDKTLIDKDLLTKEEIYWFNNYHQQVYEKLAPLLDDAHKTWLQEKTAAL